MEKIITREEPELIEAVRKHGFKVFDTKDFDLNIIGVRNLTSKKADLFDDEIHIIYKERGFWVDEYGPATTEPGKHYLIKKNYKKGVAILKCPQQIRGGYVLGPHGKTKYEALVNWGKSPTTIIRDNDWDGELDYDGEESTGYIGINIHRASLHGDGITERVGPWSAGCQVWQNVKDFERMIFLCHEQINHNGDGYKTFTYTLIGR